MKRYLIFLLALLIFISTAAYPAFATETTEETVYVQPERPAFYCGEAVSWSFSEGTLVLSGNGAMDDLTEWVPWGDVKDEIKTLIVNGNVTYIGAHAFTDCDSLTEVNFGSALTHIGAAAFQGCDGLTEISLPRSFKRFGEDSFRSCRNLTAIHCDGGFPSFNLNCLWDTYTKIYYPADRPWGLTYIEQLESAFQGRIEFLASDGSDPYVPTLPEDYTEPTTAPTTAPTTEPTTEPTAPTAAPATEPATEPSTVPASLPETEPETTAETVEESRDVIIWETVEPEQKPERSGNGWIGVSIISGALALVALGALIFLRRRYD